MTAPNEVARHYAQAGLLDRILTALRTAGKDTDALAVDDLAPVDEFHIRGRVATEELAGWVALGEDHRVLDAGSGLGGTSRFLASRFGCDVTGVDLTEEYCDVATHLSESVGLGAKTRFRQGSALELPFEDGSFDVVWTEHVQMNIPDKEGFYAELARVLKPGGRLAFHDIFAGPAEGVAYPVPWASRAELSHLAPVASIEAALDATGMTRERWEDKTDDSVAFFHAAIEARKKDGAPPVGIHLLMGEDAPTKFANVLANLESDRLRVVQAVYAK